MIVIPILQPLIKARITVKSYSQQVKAKVCINTHQMSRHSISTD